MPHTDTKDAYGSIYSRSAALWTECATERDVTRWDEYLERIEIADHLAFIEEQGATLIEGKFKPLHEWLAYVNRVGSSQIYEQDLRELTIEEQLALATYDRWRGKLERLLNTPERRDHELPRRGVVHYFSDRLRVCILVPYRVVGSAVELLGLFALPEPKSFTDPIHALSWANSDSDLDVLRRSLYSRHKVVVQRNTLTYIDRELEVFGPSIDTLFVNDWLFENRYVTQRRLDNEVYFEEILPRQISAETKADGSTFLEVGCGNGLITATYARNEVKVKAFTAVDVAPEAVATTYKNSAFQRVIHRGNIGDRGVYQIAQYDIERVSGPYDLVVCNPPYIPQLPGEESKHPLARATIGTALIGQLIGDLPHLLSPTGVMVIVASTMAEPEIMAALPSTFECERVAEMDVPFQVEALSTENPDRYLTWLLSERGLRRTNHPSDSYVHTVAIWTMQLSTVKEQQSSKES